MHRCYAPKTFHPDTMDIIRKAEEVCADYAAQGFDLTLRQLYYQFVARGWLPNRQTEYKRLGSIINDARLAGLLDWNYIVDRTRNVRSLNHWDSPDQIVRSSAQQFLIDKWADQSTRVEVWIEKDALVGVVERVCNAEQVPFFSCRGYTSQSEVWGAAQRLGEHLRTGQDVLVVHLGDHDPSGIDMTRDIAKRLSGFFEKDIQMAVVEANSDLIAGVMVESGCSDFTQLAEVAPDDYAKIEQAMAQSFGEWGNFRLERIALNMDQIAQYDPPPNPAKVSDSRARGYMAEHGDESWELDALEPTVLGDLIRDAITAVRDQQAWEQALEQESEHRQVLERMAERWDEVARLVAE